LLSVFFISPRSMDTCTIFASSLGSFTVRPAREATRAARPARASTPTEAPEPSTRATSGMRATSPNSANTSMKMFTLKRYFLPRLPPIRISSSVKTAMLKTVTGVTYLSLSLSPYTTARSLPNSANAVQKNTSTWK